MHKPFEPELSSDRLEFQLNEAFHYPASEMIAGGMVSNHGVFEPAPLERCEPPEPEIANPTLEDKVRREILAACRRANWKLGGPRGAAARLGLSRTTLFYKMKRLGIAPPGDPWRD